MGYPVWVYINVYTFIIGILLLFFNRKWRTNNDKRDRVFTWMLIIELILTIADGMGRTFQISTEGYHNIVTRIGNYIVFGFDPIYYVFTILYVESWVIGENETRARYLKEFIVWVGVINALLVTASEVFGLKLFYYYDANNVYHRGNFFILRVGVLFLCLVIGVIYCIKVGAYISEKYKTTVILYPIICSAGCILQSVSPDLPVEYAACVLASMVLFVYLQSRDSTDDFLTGSMNRRSLDATLEEKIAAATSKETTFSAIMIDVDYFKDINDTYGHAVGDTALQDVIVILKSCLRSEDQIARYGGDEFFVISPINEMEYLEKAVRRIRNRLDDFNESGERKFKLSLSLGYDIYDYESGMTAEKFIKHLDDMMYAEKEKHHQEVEANRAG
ncbi:MAG: GGDEF domain-containing protein [Eubacterium sp.]|nr:GGDEF domain-containing protein [Eubacterium sp.]